MASLSNIVSVTVSLSAANVTRQGFGTPLIPAYDLPTGFLPGQVRSYSSQSAVLGDFPGTGVWKSPTAAATAKIFAQNPAPPLVKIGGAGSVTKPVQVIKLFIPATVVVGQVFSVTIDGQLVTFTAATTVGNDVADGLDAAADLLTFSPVFASITATHTPAVVTFTANAGGDFHAVGLSPVVANAVGMDVEQDTTVTSPTAAANLATDLALINQTDSNWYALCTLFNAANMIVAGDTFVEAQHKLYVAQTSDSKVATVAAGSDTASIAYTLKNSTATRTALIYKQSTDDFADAAWLGAVLPLTPGTETWAFKQLATVQADPLTDTQHSNVIAKFANTYETYAGLNMTSNNAVTSGNEYIDIVRLIDDIVVTIQADVLQALASAQKIPMTDPGISAVQGVILTALQGFERTQPAPGLTPKSSQVIVPKAKDVSSGNKAARNLAPVTFSAGLAGAIQAVGITGVVTQ